jgi:ADP-ribose pyrophosphatase
MDAQKAEVRSSRVVYKGKIVSVEVADVRLPHGARSRMEVVHHPGSVVLVPMPDADHIVLVRQYRYPVDRFLWELPAGSLNPGEDPQAGAVRECEEEIGLVPAIVEPIGRFFSSPGYCDEFMMLFRMSGLQKPKPGNPVAQQDEDEHIEVQTFSLEEARAMVKSGEIVDLKTALALAMLAGR